jgi:hyperosmotically inducible periplasmic protein
MSQLNEITLMNLSKFMCMICATALFASAYPSFAAEGDGNQSNRTAGSKSQDADNTGRNVRDRSDSTLTPGDQGNSKQDIEITRQIRRALTSNRQLSTSAKNIKIITVDGKVTLRGPVNNSQEKQDIEAAAKKAGGNNIDNQLEIKTKH